MTKPPDTTYIGSGRDASVREIIKLVPEVNNETDTQVIEKDRRTGDPSFLCAVVTLAKLPWALSLSTQSMRV